MSETQIIIVIVAIFVVVFPLLWCAIVFLISRISSWADIARHFPGEESAEGEAVNFASLRLRAMSAYSNCLTIHVSHRGIHLKPLIFFRPGHSPIFVPWDNVSAMRRGGLGPFHSMHMNFGPAGEPNRFYAKFFGRRVSDLMERYAPGRLKS